MSKSILVRDTPNSCFECEFIRDGYVTCPFVDDVHKFGWTENCHPQCPLQPTDELLEALEELNSTWIRYLNCDYKLSQEQMGDSASTILKYTVEEQKTDDEETIGITINTLYKALGGKVDE